MSATAARPAAAAPPDPPVACEQCGHEFTPTRRQHCQHAPAVQLKIRGTGPAHSAASREDRPPGAQAAEDHRAAAAPDFSQGTCTHVPASQAALVDTPTTRPPARPRRTLRDLPGPAPVPGLVAEPAPRRQHDLRGQAARSAASCGA